MSFPLTVAESDRHVLERRLRAANTLRNGMLQHALAALDACRADPAWTAARLLSRKTPDERQARGTAYAAIRERHGLTEAALVAVERGMRAGCWIGDHITARLGHVIVKDVLNAIDGHLFLRRGKPRFRRADDCRTISSLQQSPMRLKGCPGDGYVLHWSGLMLPIRKRDFSESDLHSLSCPIVHCRVKRLPSGRVAPASPWRYELQVIVKGRPFVHRPRATNGVAGIDTGPTMVGVVWRDGPEGDGHELIPLAAAVERDEAVIRRSSRRLDRQVRAANPHCFDDRGQWRKGQRIQHQSNRNKREMASRRRREEKAARHRRNSHGRDTNRILGKAAEIRFEGHGFRGWTALWGRQMGRGAPGMFMSELMRKCRDSGGSVVVIDHRKAALSQMDTSGERLKKPLRRRHHELSNGAGFVQRDLHSALLASHCDAAGNIDLVAAAAALEAQCQGLVRPSAAEAAGMAEAARARIPPKPRLFDRRSGSNGSREVPSTREVRREAWLRGRIATRRARKGPAPPVWLA